MATVEQCEQALRTLAERLAASESTQRSIDVDRTIGCTIRDLGVTFAGRLSDGQLIDIKQTEHPDGVQARLTMTSDDLVALVDGRLKFAPALATGRIKVRANWSDMLKLRRTF